MRSAHTPAKTETIACGKNPNIAASAKTTPDFVESVRCHKMAYCTRNEPNIEIVWPVMKIAIRRFQPGIELALLASVETDSSLIVS